MVAVAFSPDDRTVFSATSRTVGVWDIGQSKLLRVLSGHAADVVDLAVAADGRRIYSVDGAGVVRAWSSSSSSAVVRMGGSFATPIPFTVSADGTVLATATTEGALVTVRLADFQ